MNFYEMRTVQFYPLSIINYTSGFIKIKLYRVQISKSIIYGLTSEFGKSLWKLQEHN